MYTLISYYKQKNKIKAYKILDNETADILEVTSEQFAFIVGNNEVVNVKGKLTDKGIEYTFDECNYREVDEINNEVVLCNMLYKLEALVSLSIASTKRNENGELTYLFSHGLCKKDGTEYNLHVTFTEDVLEIIVLNRAGQRLRNLTLITKDPDNKNIESSFNQFMDKLKNWT